MKKVSSMIAAVAMIAVTMGCGQSPDQSSQTSGTEATSTETNEAADEAKGFGPIKEVQLTNPLDQAKVDGGKSIFDLKCSSCHHLDNTKLVGPGWKDVTHRRKPEWIMNFAINVEENLNKDATAMALLEECLVRMPNQNLSETDARNILEFMRHNDGEK